MTKTVNLIAFDLGAESGRVVLAGFDGNRLQLSEVHRFANNPVRVPDGLHWDIFHLWSEFRRGISLAAQQGNLSGMGVDTWGVDFGLLDKQGVLIGNPYHYRDDRTDGMMEEAFRLVPRQEIFFQTGTQFMQLNSLFQLVAMAVKRSPALEIAETFLTIPDLFNYWLTGRKVCEFTNATTTQCYNPILKDWARPMLERLGIPAHIFPEIVTPGTILGTVSKSVADDTGSPAIPVIAPACHDTGSAVAAVPARSPNFVWISSGTWSIVGIDTKEPVISDQSLAYNMTNEGGVCDTFRYSKNVMGLWLVQECRNTWTRLEREYSYDELTGMARSAEPLRSIIDPDANEFLKHGDMPKRIQAFCTRTGQPVPESKGAILRCAVESIALKYRLIIERLEASQGRRMDTVHIVGGGTKNRLLSQLTADATGRTVLTGPVEATSIGNALVQAIALGELASLEEAREVVRRSFEIETFEPTGGLEWGSAYNRLLKLL